MTDTTDQELVTLILSGDTDSFAQLIDKYQHPLLRYVTYLIKESDLAQDIVQRSFIKAYKALNSYNNDYKFSSWLYRIAHNEAMNQIKHHNRTSTVDLNPLKNLFASPKQTPEEELDKKHTKKLVQDSLNELNPEHKAILTLYYLEDQSYQDISDILKIPINTVGSRMYRAKQNLKNTLKKKV